MIRNVDRTVKDLESQIQRREKQNAMLVEDVNKARDKISNLLTTIDELQTSDSQSQLERKRAEREVLVEREKALRLERELEGWKGLRMERRVSQRTGRSSAMVQLNEMVGAGEGERSTRREGGGSRKSSANYGGLGLSRKESNTKGFL
jgi:myosin protein heavy chain